MELYENDSFFTLTLAGRIGLAVLSALLMASVLWIGARSFGKINLANGAMTLAARLILALAFFWLFEWLSPQIYYQYYRLIFDGLPQQIVIKMPPLPADIAALLAFNAKQALSHHARAILGWALIAQSLLASTWRLR